MTARIFSVILSHIEGTGNLRKKVEADYPKEAKPNYEGKKVFQIFNFCCIAAVVLCIMLNLILTPDLHWWIFAVAGGFSMWLAFATGYLEAL